MLPALPSRDKAGPKRLISIRAGLLSSMLGLLLVLGAASMLGLLYSGNRLLKRTANTVIVAREAQAAIAVEEFFQPAKTQTLAAEHWARSGLLRAGDTAAAARLLMPLCDGAPQISEAHLCDGQSSISLERREGGWVSATFLPQYPGLTQMSRWPEPHEQADREWKVNGSRDLSQTDWYQAALSLPAAQSNYLLWTQRPGSEEAGEPSLTLSHRVEASAGPPLVIAFDIRLHDLDEFIDHLRPTPHGYVVITDLNGELMESPEEEAEHEEAGRALEEGRQPEAEGELIESQEFMFEEALKAWQHKDRQAHPGTPASRIPQDWLRPPGQLPAFRFAIRQAPWWVGVTPLELDGQPRFYLLVLIPESDLSSEFRNLRLTLLGVGIASLLLALLLGNRLAAAYTRPITALARESQRFRRLDLGSSGDIEVSRVLEISQLAAAHESMRSALDSFSRYLPLDLVRELLSRGEAARLGGELRELTILISDIRGFTAISGRLSAGELVEQLGRYNNVLLEAMRAHDGTVDKLTGDGIVAFWGAPQEDAEQSRHAVLAALDAAARLAEFNHAQRESGQPEFPTCFGIARGPVVVGNIGADWRLNYTALGNAVNLASRLERVNREHGTAILVSPEVRSAAGDCADWRLVGQLALRGVEKPADVYEPRPIA